MVAFFKLANVLGLCLLGVKASSGTPQPAERNVGFTVTHASVETVDSSVNSSVVAARGPDSDTSPVDKRALAASQVYICVTLSANVNGQFSVGGAASANTVLKQGTCVCVYASVSIGLFGPQITTRVYLSDGTLVSGSGASSLAGAILNSQCGVLNIDGISCGSSDPFGLLGNLIGGIFGGTQTSNQASVGTGVCIYALVNVLGVATGIDYGFNAQVAGNIGYANLRPSTGAGVGLATQGYSQCCALKCGTGQISCGGVCYTATTCPSGTVQTRRRRNQICPAGKKACPVPGSRSLDCVDIETNVETCGGCVNPLRPNARNSGVDCTAIQGAGDVACVRGKCQIRSCAPRFALSADGSSCERISSPRKNKDVLRKARRS